MGQAAAAGAGAGTGGHGGLREQWPRAPYATTGWVGCHVLYNLCTTLRLILMMLIVLMVAIV